MSAKNLLIVLGATASGKTSLAVQLAHRFNGEIISADSRQVFKGMDIGTGKDLEAYRVGESTIPYHLIDIKTAGERYQVNAYQEDFYRAYKEISDRDKLPILCGGTAMYIHSLLQNHQLTAVPVNYQLRDDLQYLGKPELEKKLNTYPVALRKQADYSSAKRLVRAIEIAEYLSGNNLETIERPILAPLVIGLVDEVADRRKKIIERLNHRIEHGLIEEVERLLKEGVPEETLVFYGLEYKFVVAYLKGQLDLPLLKERLGTAICQYAKRQMTFFRKMEKDGIAIHWISAKEPEKILKEAIGLLENQINLK